MTTRFQKLHITSRLISAYLFANTEMYEAINKLRNYSIIYANFIHEYGVKFHELYRNVSFLCTCIYPNDYVRSFFRGLVF